MTRHNTRRTTAAPTVEQYADALKAERSAWDRVRYADKASLPSALAAHDAAKKAALAASRAWNRKAAR